MRQQLLWDGVVIERGGMTTAVAEGQAAGKYSGAGMNGGSTQSGCGTPCATVGAATGDLIKVLLWVHGSVLLIEEHAVVTAEMWLSCKAALSLLLCTVLEGEISNS